MENHEEKFRLAKALRYTYKRFERGQSSARERESRGKSYKGVESKGMK